MTRCLAIDFGLQPSHGNKGKGRAKETDDEEEKAGEFEIDELKATRKWLEAFEWDAVSVLEKCII